MLALSPVLPTEIHHTHEDTKQQISDCKKKYYFKHIQHYEKCDTNVKINRCCMAKTHTPKGFEKPNNSSDQAINRHHQNSAKLNTRVYLLK